MTDWSHLRTQSLAFRGAIHGLLAGEEARAHIVPPGWRNNLHWHLGHLVTSPQLLTRGLAGEPLGDIADFRAFFARGTSPAEWTAEPPPYGALLDRLVEPVGQLFDDFADRQELAYAQPYPTTLGLVLSTPAEALHFSNAHDGVHLGLLLALKRALNALEG